MPTTNVATMSDDDASRTGRISLRRKVSGRRAASDGADEPEQREDELPLEDANMLP